jgi:hypothetical protein
MTYSPPGGGADGDVGGNEAGDGLLLLTARSSATFFQGKVTFSTLASSCTHL